MKRQSSDNGIRLNPVRCSIGPELLRELLERLPKKPDTIWVGFSGGLDSTVLLDIASQAKSSLDPVNLGALHVNHQLQPEAKAFEMQCMKVAAEKGIKTEILQVDASSVKGESPEETARRCRYQAFSSKLMPGDALLLAHHQDDQAETILLQMLRGAGIEGLSGMPMRNPLGEAWILRPLLGVDRTAILTYALAHGLEWIEDPSNQSDDFSRNYLRNTILPQLRQRWPALSRTIARSGQHISRAALAIKNRQEDLAQVTSQGRLLNLSAIRSLETDAQALAIRGWFRSNDFRMPSTAVLDNFIRSFVDSSPERTPLFKLGGSLEIRRYQDVAHLIKLSPLPEDCVWDLREPVIQLPENNGALSFTLPVEADTSKVIERPARLQIRYRKGGERIRLENQRCHHELRNLFQEHQIPPWIRDRIPLIYFIDQGIPELISIGGIWQSEKQTNWPPLKFSWDPPDGIDPSGALKKRLL